MDSITLIARQQGWSRRETAQAALKAETGHLVSTLLIGLRIRAAFMARNDIASPPIVERSISIFESGVPPRFRLSGVPFETLRVETMRDAGERQTFFFVDRGGYWESIETIPDPHGSRATISAACDGRVIGETVVFAEHDDRDHHAEPPRDPVYRAISGGSTMVVTHAHVHRHGTGAPHRHLHDHGPETMHDVHDGRSRAAIDTTIGVGCGQGFSCSRRLPFETLTPYVRACSRVREIEQLGGKV